MQNHLNLFSSLPTLRTKRLTLRPVRMSDAAGPVRVLPRSRGGAARPVGRAHAPSTRPAPISGYLHPPVPRPRQPATFVHRPANETRKAIGTIGFMWVQTGEPLRRGGLQPQPRLLEPRHHDRGADRPCCNSASTRLNLNRIEAQHESDNPASGRVMRKRRHEATRARCASASTTRAATPTWSLYAILRQDLRFSAR